MVDVRNLIGAMGRLERKLKAKLRSLVRVGTLSTVKSDSGRQELQVGTLPEDVRDDVQYFEQYGFTSAPLPQAECIVLNVGGDTGHAVALAAGDRTVRPTDLSGSEVAMYHLNECSIRIQDDATVVLTTPQLASITINPDGSIDIAAAAGQTVNLSGTAGPALAVARETDPVSTPQVDAIEVACSSFVPPGAPDGGAALSAAISAAILAAAGATITSGGTGSTST